jgi:hypothetical protein
MCIGTPYLVTTDHGCTGAAMAAVAEITASSQIVVQARGEAAVAFGAIVMCHSGLADY